MTVAAAEPRAAEIAVARRTASALDAVVRGQHASGEILAYRRDRHGNHAQVRTPFVSACVHDALACFDPTSPHWLDGGLDMFPPQMVAAAARVVVEVRRRLRAFLLWQQESDGTWRAFGRGSGVDPDVSTTTAASLALAEGPGACNPARRELEIERVLEFGSVDGPFFTFLKPRHGGYGWLSDGGLPVVAFDRVVNAEVLRFLCLSRYAGGDEARRLAQWLLQEAAAPDARAGSPLYPNPVVFAFALAQAAEASSGTPWHADLVTAALACTRGLQDDAGGFGGPLSTAMGATALLRLGEDGAELDAAHAAVVRARGIDDSWPYEDYAVNGFGAPAWTTALALGFLARRAVAVAEVRM